MNHTLGFRKEMRRIGGRKRSFFEFFSSKSQMKYRYQSRTTYLARLLYLIHTMSSTLLLSFLDIAQIINFDA